MGRLSPQLQSRIYVSVVAVVAFFLLLLAIPTTADSQQPGGVLVTGTIVAEGTGQPLAGAMVVIDDSETGVLTDRLGGFRLTVPAPGTHELRISRIGHEVRVVRAEVSTAGVTELGVIELATAAVLLDQVQATATRDERSIGDVAAMVDLVSRDRVDRAGRVELTQALENVPGLVTSAQYASFKSVMLRGMPREGNEWTNTLLLIDGVPQTDSRNSARVINLPINDLSQIEVVRGPNSAQYGRTAIGGVVNVVTRDPTPALRSDLEVHGGEAGYLKAMGSLSGPLGDRTGYYLSASTTRSGGFHEQEFDFGIEQHAIYSKLTFAPDPRSSALLSANYVTSDNSVPTPIPVVGGRPLHEVDPAFSRLRNVNLSTANYHQEELRTTGNYSRVFGDKVTFEEVLGFRRIQYRFDEDGDGIGGVDLDSQTVWQYPFESKTDENILYQDARLRIRSPFGGIENSLQMGLTVEHISGYAEGNLIFTDEDELGWKISYVNPELPDRSEWQYMRYGGNDYQLTMGALYAHFTAEPTSWLVVDAAARYDRAWMDNVQRLAAGEPRTKDEFDAFSPKVSTTFRLLQGRPTASLGSVTLNAYATYSEAFLPPRVPSALRVGDAEVDLVPEDITNYEAGVKGAVLDGRLGFEAAWFQMVRDGIIVNVREGPFFRPSNAGRQDFRGFEGALTWSAGAGVSLFANAAMYRHRFGDDFVIHHRSDPARDIDLSGNRLRFSPEHVLNGGLDWVHHSGLGLNVNVKHLGERYVDQTNSIRLDPTTIVDAAASWDLDRIRVTLAAQNLFDTEYVTEGSESSLHPAAPRQVRLIGSFSPR